jgi:hypothetical protein
MKLLTASLLLFLFTFSCCFSQDLTGTWEGRVGGTWLKMVLSKQGNTYIGYTHDKEMGYCIANFVGEFTDSTRQLKGAGEGFIEKTFGHVLMSYKLKFTARADGKFLTGSGRPKSAVANVLSFGIPEPTQLRLISTEIDTTAFMYSWLNANSNRFVTVENKRKGDSIQTKNTTSDSLSLTAVKKNDEPLPEPDKDLPAFNKKVFDDSIRTVKTERQADVLKRIVTHADSIVITISDNEIVDGDTITIFHNNEILVSRLFVSARPYRIVIPMTPGMPSHEFVLVANNLGNIPPNTALVTIEAGRERYQLKAASDMKKNAVIVLEHRK